MSKMEEMDTSSSRDEGDGPGPGQPTFRKIQDALKKAVPTWHTYSHCMP